MSNSKRLSSMNYKFSQNIHETIIWPMKFFLEFFSLDSYNFYKVMRFSQLNYCEFIFILSDRNFLDEYAANFHCFDFYNSITNKDAGQ